MAASLTGLRNEMEYVDGNFGDFFEERASGMDDEDDEHECDLCGDDHEVRDCDQTWCRNCDEMVDNCDCDETDEADAEDYVAERLRLRR